MAFGHLAGVSTAGAADEIVDWFATFEAWMTGVLGWTVEAGAGTTAVIFKSVGEVGGLGMLYMRVWRVGNHVHIEVRDDLAGTHFTNEGGYVDSGGVQFAYWMSGDRDAINVCFKSGVGYRSVYAGLVIPFARVIPDETYQMVATSEVSRSSILRDWNNVWDVDINSESHTQFVNVRRDRYDGSFPPSGVWAGQGANIAGQFKHISTIIQDPSLPAECTFRTGLPGATSEWIVLEDSVPYRYAMRTGGIPPTGISMQGANFAATSGVAANWGALLNDLAAHLVAIGWQDLGDPGIPNFGREFYTAGESGEDELWCAIVVINAAPDQVLPYIWDDAAHTHAGGALTHLDDLEFPVNYWITADRDCFLLMAQRPAGYVWVWMGISEPYAPALIPPYAAAPLTPYRAIAMTQLGTGGLLRQHNGVWGVATLDAEHGAPANSSPNSFDGVTYVIWPYAGFYGYGGGVYEAYGQMKYLFHAQSPAIANLDTITIGAQVYTAFLDTQGEWIAMRTT